MASRPARPSPPLRARPLLTGSGGADLRLCVCGLASPLFRGGAVRIHLRAFQRAVRVFRQILSSARRSSGKLVGVKGMMFTGMQTKKGSLSQIQMASISTSTSTMTPKVSPRLEMSGSLKIQLFISTVKHLVYGNETLNATLELSSHLPMNYHLITNRSGYRRTIIRLFLFLSKLFLYVS